MTIKADMRIVHIACVAPPENGGIGQAAYREVQGLVERGHDAVLVAPQVDGLRADPFVLRLPTWWRLGNASSLRGLSHVIRDADVVHVHYPFFGSIESVVLGCRRFKKPLVLTFHMDATTSEWRGILFKLHRFLLQSFLFSSAVRVIVSSMDYALHSSAARWVQSHPKQVLELPFGIETDQFVSPVSREAHSEFRLLMVGGLDKAHRFKGLPEMLQALAGLPSDVRLTVVGSGDDRVAYEQEALKLGISDRVHFAGRLSLEALRSAFQSSDLFVFPSTSQAEAFGLVVAEAQACGLPVIASDLPGVRTVIEAGMTGILIPPRDVSALRAAIERAYSDRDWLQEAGLRARARAATLFDHQRHIDRLLELYQSLV